MFRSFARALALCLCLGCLCWAAPAAAGGVQHTKILQDRTIGEGETLAFTTVDAKFADSPYLPEGMFPGELTVQLQGTIVVENGGCLSIGPLAVGGPEASPVISATLSQDAPRIIVRAGGQLELTSVELELEGQGPFIQQEEGAYVRLTAMDPLEEGLAQWAGPQVNNLYDKPRTLYLTAGTVLVEELLPASEEVTLQDQGAERDLELAIAWDLSGYDGRTSGELELAGSYLDEQGEPVASLRPLSIRVCWYDQTQIEVEDVIWKGDQARSLSFLVRRLPEGYSAWDVWGEVSYDGGDTWEKWEELDPVLDSQDEEAKYYTFYSPGTTPCLYRLAAQAGSLPTIYSPSYLLPEKTEAGQEEDQGGNRGGSISPIQGLPGLAASPSPEPSPAASPSPSPAATPSPAPSSDQQPESEPRQEADGHKAMELSPEETPLSRPKENAKAPSSAPAPSGTAAPDPTAQPQAEPSPQTGDGDAEPLFVSQERRELSPLGQALLVISGVAVCVGVGVAVARPWRKRR